MDLAKATKYLGSMACACVVIGCQQDDGAGPSNGALPSLAGSGGAGVATSPPGMPGLQRTGDQLVMQTEPFTVQPGQEKYVCWTTKVGDGFKVQSYSKSARPYLHHLVFTSTTKEEPAGIRDCDAAFQLSWRPLFAAGAGNVDLTFPQGVAQSIEAGTQLLAQLHLVNSSEQPVTDSFELVMNLTEDQQTQNVGYATVGDTDIELPPGQTTSVVADCQNPVNTRVIGFFPHMHLMGTSMTLELGSSVDSMQTIYKRDPFDFNDQRIDTADMMLPAGQHVRLTCNYNNTKQQTVVYGESTFNEMCYLIMFVVGPPTGCIRGSVPPSVAGSPMGAAGGSGGGAAGAGGSGAAGACTDIEIMPGVVMPGCCAQGMCGADVSNFQPGVGCVELGQFASGAMQAGYMLNLPAPHAFASP